MKRKSQFVWTTHWTVVTSSRCSRVAVWPCGRVAVCRGDRLCGDRLCGCMDVCGRVTHTVTRWHVAVRCVGRCTCVSASVSPQQNSAHPTSTFTRVRTHITHNLYPTHQARTRGTTQWSPHTAQIPSPSGSGFTRKELAVCMCVCMSRGRVGASSVSTPCCAWPFMYTTVYVCTCVCVCVSLCVATRIYTHSTHTHTHTQSALASLYQRIYEEERQSTTLPEVCVWCVWCVWCVVYVCVVCVCGVCV